LQKYEWGFSVHMGSYSIPFITYMSVMLFICLFQLISIYRRTKVTSRKREIGYVISGCFLALPAIMNWLPSFNINVFPFGFVFICLFGWCIAYAVLKYELFGFESILLKTGLWILTSSLFVLPLFITFSSTKMLKWMLDLTPLQFFSILVVQFTVFFFYYLFFSNKIQPIIDMFFQRKKFIRDKLLHEFLEYLVEFRDIASLSKKIVEVVKKGVCVNTVGILIYSKNLRRYEGTFKGERIFLRGHSPLSELLRIEGKIIDEDWLRSNGEYGDAWVEGSPFMKIHNIHTLIPLSYKKELMAILCLSRNEDGKPFDRDDITFLTRLQQGVVITLHNSLLLEKLRQGFLETIGALAMAMEAKDEYTQGHSERVTFYSKEIGKKMELNKKQIERLHYAGLLHDIGKIGINDQIINHTRSLSEKEYMEIKKHTRIGERIIQDIEFLQPIRKIIKYHHERIDGAGYYGKKSSEVPLEASIIAIADAFDAMTSNRPYRKAMDVEDAVREIKNNEGSQFHPDVVDVFMDWMKEKARAGHEKEKLS
jgi:putative nucleotidyltransferase with HDIG domain